MTEPSIHPPDFTSFFDQHQSPLFSLPPEIRDEIFAFALSSYEDTTRAYSKGTYWTRPGYSAPHRTCTELLRTCKRVYSEAWFMPFAYAEHSFYLTSSNRAPGSLTPVAFEKCLAMIDRIHGQLEAGHIRIFAQMFVLEPGNEMQRVLGMPHFHPTSITLTLRYTDFWFWEDNEPLRIGGRWVNSIRFPSSVSRFRIDFESIERRKGEVDYIANEAADSWFFHRVDGQILTARKSETAISKWTGSSVLGETRWIRDEVRPSQLDYHVVTVTWRVSNQADVKLSTPYPSLRVPYDFDRPDPPLPQGRSIGESSLRAAGISPDTPAEETLVQYREWLRTRRQYDSDESDEYEDVETEEEDDDSY
ncbi:hypothetical protein ASPWEDRAFT_28617 [Aspergillus wentii DTO 134E9]|uniref:F-box domain-containing protein n=1 Tax=Aspergillus wentii DTO 134E9 TaxID=1073089 RepID=A0A1L9RMG6_ASPWE|nr:uncharacterized protein ASPWEDRAFT_28617 [Aspergillus wentii DTO 134E9]KAI9929530.1 hypothetical protein MW887_001003 [Aspergillus wentii]OJJ36027.1 hypothetical protein ASPWEDRAFT_28617 [Aspergillus wentii DTO 134E9]